MMPRRRMRVRATTGHRLRSSRTAAPMAMSVGGSAWPSSWPRGIATTQGRPYPPFDVNDGRAILHTAGRCLVEIRQRDRVRPNSKARGIRCRI